MSPKDLIGKRGENIAMCRLLDFCGNALPYFDPHLLGDKFPTYDMLIELTGMSESKPYFFAQVKSTESAGNKRSTTLRVMLKAEHVRSMVACPIPTYVIGVDEKAEVAYIVSIHGNIQGKISAIPKKYPLNARNLKLLYDEVAAVWKTLSASSISKSSRFAL
jgi:hypothetical protein